MALLQKRYLAVIGSVLALWAGSLLADHKLDARHFDHIMYAANQLKSVRDSALALECDQHYASIDPGGYIGLDIGHRRHFVSAQGPDLTAFTRGSVAYEMLVASGLNNWTSVGQSEDSTDTFEIGDGEEFQYVRIKNKSMTELKVDCVVAHALTDHPEQAHGHHGAR